MERTLQALWTLTSQSDDRADLLSAVLSAAIRAEWDAAFDYLLRQTELVINRVSPASRNNFPLLETVRHGRLAYLTTLLEPSVKLQRTGRMFEGVIRHAASYAPPNYMEMIELLLARGPDLVQPKVRSEIFFAACMRGDRTLAQRMLEDGEVDLYHRFPGARYCDAVDRCRTERLP